MGELNPCPFCGNEHPMITENSMGVQITCPVCQTKFRCDCTAGHDYSKAETVKRWNRRAQPADEPLTLEQLREMDFMSDPIWDSCLNTWCVVRTKLSADGKAIYYFGGGNRPLEANRFYRRPPERSTDGKT